MQAAAGSSVPCHFRVRHTAPRAPITHAPTLSRAPASPTAGEGTWRQGQAPTPRSRAPATPSPGLWDAGGAPALRVCDSDKDKPEQSPSRPQRQGPFLPPNEPPAQEDTREGVKEEATEPKALQHQNLELQARCGGHSGGPGATQLRPTLPP